MNFRRLKHTLLRLSAQEKVIGLSTMVMMIGAFMPWYSLVLNFNEEGTIETALSGDLGVIGFVIFILAILGLLYLVAENLHLPVPKLGYKRENILFFFLGQSVFLTLLMIGVYTKRSLDYTDASLRFGSYTVLVAAFFGAFAAFSLIQKNKRQIIEEFYEEDESEMSEEGMIEEPGEGIEEMGYASEMEGEIDSIFEEENNHGHPNETSQMHSEPQGDFFTREAGIQEEDNPNHRNESNDFYQDK